MSDPLGQHFLRPRSARKVVDAAALGPASRVLDVGAGRGALTQELARKVGASGRVVAVELDAELAGRLRAIGPNVAVLVGDALQIQLPTVDAVVANPPFRIAAPLLRRLATLRVPMTLVLPRELADRLTAREGSEEFGRLTIQVGAWAASSVVARLFGDDFEPAPEVDCAIVQAMPRGDVAPRLLESLLDAAWEGKAMRVAINPLAKQLGLPTEEIAAIFDGIGVRDVMPFKVGVAQWSRIARQLDEAVARRKRAL